MEGILKWYSAHAYWFLGTALLFLGIAAYFNLFRYPTKTNKILMGVNVVIVGGLVYLYWI